MRKDVSFAYDEPATSLLSVYHMFTTVYKSLSVLSLWYVTVQSICDYLCVSADEYVCVCVCLVYVRVCMCSDYKM